MKFPQFFSFTHLRKVLFFGIPLFFLCVHAQAQNTESTELSKINLYVDFGGGFARGLASINIESRISSGNKLTWYARGGIGGGGLDAADGPGILGAVTMLTGKGNNHFEVNAGTFIGKYSDVQAEYFFLPILDLGYRYQKPEGGLVFNAEAGFLGIRFGLGYAF